jgi:hypothetical protein
MPRVKTRRNIVLIPTSEHTRGHGTTRAAAILENRYLVELPEGDRAPVRRPGVAIMEWRSVAVIGVGIGSCVAGARAPREAVPSVCEG